MDEKDNSDHYFTKEEREAMAERTKEISSKRKKSGMIKNADLEKEVLMKISQMDEPDKTIATSIHNIIREISPSLISRTWYGMPAYERNGQIIIFFQERNKFKNRYSTIGFTDKAHLDDGTIWPTAFAVTEWNKKVNEKMRELIERAILP